MNIRPVMRSPEPPVYPPPRASARRDGIAAGLNFLFFGQIAIHHVAVHERPGKSRKVYVRRRFSFSGRC